MGLATALGPIGSTELEGLMHSKLMQPSDVDSQLLAAQVPRAYMNPALKDLKTYVKQCKAVAFLWR